MNPLEKLSKPGFSLVLSGGAALGCAHIGVVRFLEEKGLSPKEIVGTSMGSIVGAALACGFESEKIEAFFSQFASMAKWVKITWTRPSILKTEKIDAVFQTLFGDRLMGDVKTPLKVAATNFETGELKVFSSQDQVPLKDAVLCSMSIPVLFPPKELEGEVYVDGFLGGNLPCEHVSDKDAPIVAVDVMSENSLVRYDDRRSILGKAKALIKSSERAFYLMVQNQTRASLALCKDVILIQPRLKEFKVFHFHKWDEMKTRGYEGAKGAFEKTAG